MNSSLTSTETHADRFTASSATVLWRIGLLVLVFLGLGPGQGRAHAAVLINELLASNAATLSDSAGEFDDWIEIYNSGTESVDLAGLYLTDDTDDPTQWQFPLDRPDLTTVPAEGYVLVWADKDVNEAELHANFALGADGETVALFDADGRMRIDRVVFPAQRPDLSFARDPADRQRWGYAQEPTPGRANAELYEGIVADPAFGCPRGFYGEPFELTLDCETPDVTVYYSLDTTGPNRVTDSWPTAQVYTEPLAIAETICVRAWAVRSGWHPSRVVTHTYLFAADIVQQEILWTTITQDELWGPQLADALRDLPTVSLVMPETLVDGQEVEASVEMIFPNGETGFQVQAGIAYGGNTHSHYAKRTFDVEFRGIYGVPTLTFDVFGNGAACEFDQLILRSGSHDSLFFAHRGTANRGIYIRNRWTCDRQLEMGHPASHGRFVHLYWNGIYWGQYHLMERPNAAFMASYFGGDKTDYDAINSGVVVDGTDTAWLQLLAAMDDYEAVTQYLDPINYADYMLLNFYGGNDWDWWVDRNWRAARRRTDGAGFQFFAWDNDAVLLTGLEANCLDAGGPGGIWFDLIDHGPFLRLFADRAQQFLFHGGMLTADRVLAQFDELAGRIERTVTAECARWGKSKKYTPETWREHLDRVRVGMVPGRTDVVIQQLRDAGMFPAIDAPTFYVNDVPQHGGPIQRTDALVMTAPQGVICYTLDGSDPRLPDEMAAGFAGDLETSLSSTALAYTSPVTLSESGSVKARAWSDGTWSALTEATFALGPVVESLRISEIMYHPAGADDPNTEYVELINVGAETLNLNGVQFTDGIDFVFPSLDLAPGACSLVVADVNAFEAEYGFDWPVAGPFTGTLSNAGERLVLQDAIGRTIHDFAYSDDWYKVTDGAGFSLTVTDPESGDPNAWSDPAIWAPSAEVGGSPGHGPW